LFHSYWAYICASNYVTVTRFDKVIAKIKRCSFFAPQCTTFDVKKCFALLLMTNTGIAVFVYKMATNFDGSGCGVHCRHRRMQIYEGYKYANESTET